MNLADGGILFIVVISALIGLWRGFVREAFSLLTWIAAFIIASLFSPGMENLLQDHIPTPSVRIAVAFGVLFVLTLFVGGLVNRLLVEMIRITGLTGTDRALGTVFGLLRGLLLVAVLVALGQQLFMHDEWWAGSCLIPRFVAVQQWLWAFSGQLLSLLMHASGRN
jgi:membrane protein required for colicin V production